MELNAAQLTAARARQGGGKLIVDLSYAKTDSDLSSYWITDYVVDDRTMGQLAPNIILPKTGHFKVTVPQKHASVHDPFDLGAIDDFDATLEGMIGAESGSQTLFCSFETFSPARIGLRLVRQGIYKDQYVEINLSDQGGLLPLGIDGFANSSLLSPQQVVTPVETVVGLGYVTKGYWASRYAVNDGTSFTVPGVTVGVVSDASASFRSPYGAIMPAGQYIFTVTSSQWPQLPFCAQLAVVPPGVLAATVESTAGATARIALVKPVAIAESQASPTGRLATPRLASGIASGEAAPTATITRVSPYGT